MFLKSQLGRFLARGHDQSSVGSLTAAPQAGQRKVFGDTSSNRRFMYRAVILAGK
jgi:hypothetical protein